MSSYLHTMVRVRDLERSVAFYSELLGMHELRRHEVPDGRYTLAFVGYATNAEGQAEIELTHNWDQETPYEVGTGFGHFAVGVPDVAAACEKVRGGGWQGDARGGAGEVRHHRDRLRGRSGRIQDRIDRAPVAGCTFTLQPGVRAL